jgi:hypothetical protein
MQKPSLAQYVLSCSATMVGVCLTSISLVKILEGRIGASRVDEYLSLNAVIFLFSAFFAYLSLRTDDSRRVTSLYDKTADLAFMIGLAVMVVIAVLFAYETI